LAQAILRLLPQNLAMPARGGTDVQLQIGEHSFVIRELACGGTGRDVFPSARVLLSLLESLRSSWEGVRVLELGAGTGVLSVALAKLGASVIATDNDAAVLKNLRQNLHRNNVSHLVQAKRWDWAEGPPDGLRLEGVQMCLGSDLAFGSSFAPLCKALGTLKAANPAVEVLLVLQERDGMAVRMLHEACSLAGLEPRGRALRVCLAGGVARVSFQDATAEDEEQAADKVADKVGYLDAATEAEEHADNQDITDANVSLAFSVFEV